MEVTVGTQLIAKSVCRMKDGSGNALIIGKEYLVKEITEIGDIVIESETEKRHYFGTDESEDGYYLVFFDVKQ
jgi:hypothetical protein